MFRRNFFGNLIAGSALTQLADSGRQEQGQGATDAFLERPLTGQPHKGKVLLALQAHADDVPLEAAGTVAKLIEEGYTGYLVRATNDDMGDAPGLGTPGTIGENVLGNERDTAKVAQVLGCEKHFDLNYNNHRMTPTDAKPAIDRRYACFRLRIGRSQIHRWGVYAGQSIPAERKVIEYTGEKIDRDEFKRRQETLYLFELDDEWTIDGSVRGSGAEFINHSCEPNLVTRVMKGHILYFSARRIRKGEELTIDYNYDDDDELMVCGCRSKTCRGTINVNGRGVSGTSPAGADTERSKA